MLLIRDRLDICSFTRAFQRASTTLATPQHSDEIGIDFSSVLILSVCLLLCFEVAFGQAQPTIEASQLELLQPIDPERRSRLIERYGYDFKLTEYFARPGTHEIYEFNVDVLKTEGRFITISPENVAPLELLSHGMHDTGYSAGEFFTWYGEVPSIHSTLTLPVELNITVVSVDPAGVVKRPDPNREITQAALQKEVYTVLADSKERLNERVVHGMINGFIQNPDTKSRIRLYTLGNNGDAMGTVVVYEVDDDKVLFMGDASVGDSTPPPRAEAIERAEAWNAYREQLRREFGLPPLSQ